MSDDGNSFDDLYNEALDSAGILDKPDINDYLDLGSEDSEYYQEAWDRAPIEGFTEGQADAFAEMLIDLDIPFDEWDEMFELWDDGGFWEWWEEHYGEAA